MTQSPLPQRRHLGRPAFRRVAESVVRGLIILCGWAATAVLAAIAGFLLYNAIPAIRTIGLWPMIAGDAWFPTGTPRVFGFLPAETGSLWVTAVSMLASIPVGIAGAVFISEFLSGRSREVFKSSIEFMAAIPSVVYGLIGMAVVAPALKGALGLPSGLTALTAGAIVGFIALPTMISISEDALHAVPDELRQGSLALGNTRWQTAYKVIVPAASSGIFAAVMLGLGRAIGETMVVLMVAGNANVIATTPLQSVATLPGRIAAEMGEAVQGSLHQSSLFAMGLVLFVVTFLVNLAADVVLEKQRKRWRR